MTLYKTYAVELAFRDKGPVGTKPQHPDLLGVYTRLLGQRAGNIAKGSQKAEGELSEEATAEFMASRTSLFPADTDGPYFEGYQVTANLRDALALSKLGKGENSTFLRFMILDGGVVVPDRLHFPLDSLHFGEAPVSPTVKGVRVSSIAKFQEASGVVLSFPIQVLDNKELSAAALRTLFIVGGHKGLGGMRHLGYGRFNLVSLRNGGTTIK